MKYIILVLTLFLFSSSFSLAQDKIYLKDGTTIDAKIMKVSDDLIEYKKASNLNGPIFEIATLKIHMVVYENGESQIFDNVTSSSKKESTFDRRNRINIELIGYRVNGPTLISYEMLRNGGAMGFEIPFNVHINSSESTYVGYTSGVNLKFYPSKEGKGFFYGPTVGLGLFDWVSGSYYSTDFSITAGAKIGGQFQFGNLFGLNISANGGIISNFSDIDFGYSANLGISFTF
jgi:hypothetical protein